VDEQLAVLDRHVAEARASAVSQLASANTELQSLAGEQTPTGRLSHEQLGRRLPAGSLFR
jgi:hypothetical protein